MSKVLIDRELLERAVYGLELAYETDTPAVRDICAVLSAPSGTPEMPVKAYYHEAPNEYGGLNKSVGLEVRKEFTDAPLVLEADAVARIACLEGEIAKRDARIVELERALKSERDTESGAIYQLRAELAAIKAQEPVGWYTEDHLDDKSATTYSKELADRWVAKGWPVFPLYAAPVSEAKAQGVVIPASVVWIDAHHVIEGNNPSFIKDVALVSAERTSETQIPLARLNAAPCQHSRQHWNFTGGGHCDDCGAPIGTSVAAPAQQVSVPASAFASRAITLYEAALLAAFPSGSPA